MVDQSKTAELLSSEGGSGGPPSPLKADVQLEGLELKDKLLKTSVTKIQLIRLAMKGLNATQAAKVVGVAPETARSYYADPDFRREVLRRVDGAFADIDQAFTEKRKTLHELIEEQAYKSAEELIEMLNTGELHPSLQVKIHQDFMNRAEDSAQRTVSHHKLDPVELKRASKVAQEMDNVIEFKRKAV